MFSLCLPARQKARIPSTVLTVKLTFLDNYFKDALSFKWTLSLWILYKDPAILSWSSFIKPLANAEFIIHEKLMSLGLTGRTEISLKSSLVICYYLSQADGWWTRPVWRSLFPALRVQALSPTSTWTDFAGFPSQMKWEIGGSQAFLSNLSIAVSLGFGNESENR